MKEVKINEYKYSNNLGEITAEITAWVDDDYNEKTFLQTGDFSIDEMTVNALSHEIVYLYLKNNFKKVQNGDKAISGREIQGIMDYIGFTNNDQFAEMIGHDKSTISRAKKGDINLSHQASFAILLLLWEEYKSPGFCKRLIGLESPHFDLPWASKPKILNNSF